MAGISILNHLVQSPSLFSTAPPGIPALIVHYCLPHLLLVDNYSHPAIRYDLYALDILQKKDIQFLASIGAAYYAPLKCAESIHMPTITVQDHVFCIGFVASFDYSYEFVNRVASVSLMSGEVKHLPDIHFSRDSPCLLHHDGYIYVLGGYSGYYNDSDGDARLIPTAACERYNLRSQHWEILPPMRRIKGHALGCATQGKLYIFRSPKHPSAESAECFDPLTQTWETVALPPRKSRTSASMIAVLKICESWEEESDPYLWIARGDWSIEQVDTRNWTMTRCIMAASGVPSWVPAKEAELRYICHRFYIIVNCSVWRSALCSNTSLQQSTWDPQWHNI